MLTIQNIEDFKGKEFNAWKILDACEGDSFTFTEVGKDIYVLTFARLDDTGTLLYDRAGVIIDREISELMSGYRIKVVYESWDNGLHTTYWRKEDIMNKNAFFGMVLHKINEEYYKQK